MSPSLRADRSCDVAVIGAGFSGTLLAIQLARQSNGKLTLALIEKRDRFARGVAYGTENASHLLNVPAGKMGAYPHDPEHFLRWCREHPQRCRAAATKVPQPGSFVPRKLYGHYLQDLLEEARARHPRLELVAGEAVDLVPRLDGRFVVELGSGQRLEAAKVVLALGNFPPGDPKLRDPRFHTSSRYLTDPWSSETLHRLSEPGDLLILGSGLTSLDLLLSLARLRRKGVTHVISRRGLFPQPHASCQPYPAFLQEDGLPLTVRAAVRLVRAEARQAARTGGDWRAVIDALRPATQEIWRRWDLVERRRFLRHVRAYWESHRHRAAPDALAIKQSLETRGRLVCHRGRVERIIDCGNALEVGFQEHGKGSPGCLKVAYVVNCTGPECNYHKLKDPLVLQLFYRGLITPDPLFLGIEVGAGGVVYNVYGERVRNLYTLGSPQKGRLLETTAVPELRVQAWELARRICNEGHGTEPAAPVGMQAAYEI